LQNDRQGILVEIYRRLIFPIAKLFEPETAHTLAILALKSGLVISSHRPDPPILQSQVFGIQFSNPIGLAAGFDKGAEVPVQAFRLGFGFVEVGTVTPRPQLGNPRPRVFRLDEDRAIINRLGFNNDGMNAVAERLKKSRARASGVIGVNFGMNRDTDDPVSDYVKGMRKLAEFGDYFVLNVSSPNTPGLRDLQNRENVRALLSEVLKARLDLRAELRAPLLIKISPDLNDEEIADVVAAVMELNIDGIIVSNTTVSRDQNLKARYRTETGGLSGRPLFEHSNKILSQIYKLTNGTVSIIGVGGIENGRDAYRKIRSGASLVQLYTALVYHGPNLISEIKRELCDLLRSDGFKNVADAVGADHR
jgi:dihydroorotate dehydrogenase